MDDGECPVGGRWYLLCKERRIVELRGCGRLNPFLPFCRKCVKEDLHTYYCTKAASPKLIRDTGEERGDIRGRERESRRSSFDIAMAMIRRFYFVCKECECVGGSNKSGYNILKMCIKTNKK